jgi:hypothetical protein
MFEHGSHNIGRKIKVKAQKGTGMEPGIYEITRSYLSGYRTPIHNTSDISYTVNIEWFRNGLIEWV